MKLNPLISRHIDHPPIVEGSMEHTGCIIFRHIDLIEDTKSAFFRTAVHTSLSKLHFIVSEGIRSDQGTAVRIYIKGNIVGRSSKHPCQVFRQNIFTRCLAACEQQIGTLEQRRHGHLQNFFPIERNLRFRDPVSYCLVNRILFSECFHLPDEHRGYFLFL